MVRYTFIVEDLHLLLLAGLPAHYALAYAGQIHHGYHDEIRFYLS